MKLTNQIGAGWGGEGFGKKECAMTIEGNWISGAMTHDYPTVPWKAVELPAGPAGKGTLQYDGGWGLAADSKNKADAMSLITYLTQTKVEMGNAKAFGVMPSVNADREVVDEDSIRSSRRSSRAPTTRRASRPVPDIATVLGDFNQQLQGLPQTDPKTILNRVNGELQSILK